MDNLPIFVPNFPPPPIRPQPPIIQNRSNLYKERLHDYLQSRRNRPSPSQKPNEIRQTPLKLSEISMNLSRFYDTIGAIKAEIENLSECTRTINSDQWNSQIAELKSQFDELSSTNQMYQNSHTCSNAKRSVEKRRRKRERIKKRKLELDALKKCQIKNRALKHQQIDQWMKRNAENNRKNLHQNEKKQRAEHVLSEIKGLKSDAAKYLLTFDALKELYRIRNRDKATTAIDGVQFDCEIEKLQKMWSDASIKYETEEKRLRAFLECSNCEEWQETLFGDVKNDDLFSLKKHENGLAKLIEIRRQWDSFVVSHDNPYGSSVPIGWTMPNTNPSIEWKTYLKDL